MDFETFKEAVFQELQRLNDTGSDISIIRQVRSNSYVQEGLLFCKAGIKASPVLYLDEFYEHYRQHGSIPDTAAEILAAYSLAVDVEFPIDDFSSFSAMKGKIIPKLVNTRWNAGMLASVPHTPFEDLSVIYFCVLFGDGHYYVTLPVTADLLRKWNTTADDLRRIAFLNFEKLFPAQFLSFSQALGENVPYNGHILTNSHEFCGTAWIAGEGWLEHAADALGENYYIIPSSIHTAYFFPESQAPSIRRMNECLQKLNNDRNDPEVLLSDHVYYYDRQSRTLIPCTENGAMTDEERKENPSDENNRQNETGKTISEGTE